MTANICLTRTLLWATITDRLPKSFWPLRTFSSSCLSLMFLINQKCAMTFLTTLTVSETFFHIVSSQNETKIRYSKWKAADIAKAIREGRQPTPGPAGSTFEDAMVAPPSGAASPTPSAPPPESLFGSIPPSISASPLRTAGQLPPLPASPTSRPVEEIEPEQEPWRGSAPPGEDVTPVSSPRRAKKALSPERPEAGSSRSVSRSKSPPSHTSKESNPSSSANRPATSTSSASSAPAAAPAKPAPQTPKTIRPTPMPGSSPPLKLGTSPGAWSTLATPGMEDNDRRATPLASTHAKENTHANRGNDPTKKVTGFLSRLYGTPSNGVNGNATKTTPSTNGHVRPTANGNGAIKHSYVVEEPGDDDDDDDVDGSVAGGDRGTLPPVYNRMAGDSAKRQDSWSSTVATRGDAPSRSSSWGFAQSPTSPSFTQEDDDEEGSDVAGDSGDVRVVSKETATSFPGVPSIALPSAPPAELTPDHANNTDEASDVLAPLPASKPLTNYPAGIPKRVHFTPSVVGGLSSVASSSPPSSPSGTLLSLGSRVPLPPSDSSDTASSEERVIVGNGDVVLTTSGVDEPPPEEYRVPQPSLPSVPPRSEAPIRESPPILPSVPPGPAGSHSRTPSAGTIPLSSPDSAENSSSPGSLSPRLRSTIAPPISAIHHHVLPSVPAGPAAPAPSNASSSSSVTAPPLPPPPPPLTSSVPDITTEPFGAPGPVHTAKYPPTPYRPAHLLSSPASSTVTPPAPPRVPLPEALDAEETNRAKKHARFAISALEYDDPDTARKELVSALKVLGVNVSL